jgi:hypothetical protein
MTETQAAREPQNETPEPLGYADPEGRVGPKAGELTDLQDQARELAESSGGTAPGTTPEA